MAAGTLRAVVATSSLDLGIDWGGVDQVIQVGAPKGVSRLLQRVGRANHRMDEASRAILVPANRFEVLECEAAILGVAAHELDGDPPRPGGLDVLAQHLLGLACSAPFLPDDVYTEVTTAAPVRRADAAGFRRRAAALSRTAATHCRPTTNGRNCSATARAGCTSAMPAPPRMHRMNIGTIVEAPLIKVRLAGNRGWAGRCWAKSRSISSTCSAPATRSCSPAGCCRSFACVRTPSNAWRAAAAARWCRPTRAGGCR